MLRARARPDAGPSLLSGGFDSSAAGADLKVRLTVGRGDGYGYYLARAIVGRRTYSVELVVPPLRLLLE